MTDHYLITSSDDLNVWLTPTRYEGIFRNIEPYARYAAEDAVHSEIERLCMRFKQELSVSITNPAAYFATIAYRGQRRWYANPDHLYSWDVQDNPNALFPSTWENNDGLTSYTCFTLSREDVAIQWETERTEDQSVVEGLAVLTARERDVFTRIAHGERHHEIAQAFGVTRQMVTKIYGRARQKIDEHVQMRVAKPTRQYTSP